MARKFEVPKEAEPYVSAMRGLLQPGVHSARPLESSVLLDLIAVQNEAGGQTTPAELTAAFIKLLKEIVKDDLEGKSRDTAELAFALGEHQGKSSKIRYVAIGELHETDWDSYRKTGLPKLLLNIYTQFYLRGAPPRQDVNRNTEEIGVAERMEPPVIGGDFVLDRYEHLYNLPKTPGDPHERVVIRDITATKDGVDAYRQGFLWWGKRVDELPTLTLFGSGKLSIYPRRGDTPYLTGWPPLHLGSEIRAAAQER
jgi:hypothetical protein